MRKYEFTGEAKLHNGSIVYRIRAIRDFGIINSGDLGGFIESEKNLSHNGNCWIYPDSIVMGNARVYDHAVVINHAQVYGNAVIDQWAFVGHKARITGNAKITGTAAIYTNVIIGHDMIINHRIMKDNKHAYC